MIDGLVSVVIPTYNRSALLHDSIKTVLDQTYNNIQIIVVDDGSTDDTSDVAYKLRDKIVYLKQANSGPGAARNAGIRKAKGEYVAFIDSDDLWREDKIERQVEFMRENPEYALCCTDFREITPEKIIHKSILENMIVKDGYVFEHLLKNQFVKTSTVMVRSKVFKQSGFFHEKLRAFEDRYLWLNIARENKIHFIPEVLVTARIQGDNITENTDVMYENFHNFYQLLLEDGRLTTNQRKLVKTIIAKNHFDMAYRLRENGEAVRSRNLYMKSLTNNFQFWTLLAYLRTFIK